MRPQRWVRGSLGSPTACKKEEEEEEDGGEPRSGGGSGRQPVAGEGLTRLSRSHGRPPGSAEDWVFILSNPNAARDEMHRVGGDSGGERLGEADAARQPGGRRASGKGGGGGGPSPSVPHPSHGCPCAGTSPGLVVGVWGHCGGGGLVLPRLLCAFGLGRSLMAAERGLSPRRELPGELRLSAG